MVPSERCGPASLVVCFKGSGTSATGRLVEVSLLGAGTLGLRVLQVVAFEITLCEVREVMSYGYLLELNSKHKILFIGSQRPDLLGGDVIDSKVSTIV